MTMVTWPLRTKPSCSLSWWCSGTSRSASRSTKATVSRSPWKARAVAPCQIASGSRPDTESYIAMFLPPLRVSQHADQVEVDQLGVGRAEREIGLGPVDAWELPDLVEQAAAQVLVVADAQPKHEVHGPGHDRDVLHLRQRPQRGQDLVRVLQRVHRDDAHVDDHGEAEAGAVQLSAVAADHSRSLQPGEPLGHRGRRHPHPARAPPLRGPRVPDEQVEDRKVHVVQADGLDGGPERRGQLRYVCQLIVGLYLTHDNFLGSQSTRCYTAWHRRRSMESREEPMSGPGPSYARGTDDPTRRGFIRLLGATGGVVLGGGGLVSLLEACSS